MSPSDTPSPQDGPSTFGGTLHPWIARQWSTASGAVVAEAAAGVSPVDVFRHAARRPYALFLDSAQVDRDEGRPPSERGADGPA
ncbi:MAG: hypothetical protein WD060_09720, partial [Pirellulales bacterium]